MKAVIFVHPWMWAPEMFTEARAMGLKIMSIVTGFETLRINRSWLSEHSDFVIEGSTDVDVDLEHIRSFLVLNDIDPVAVINGIDSALHYTDCLQKAFLYPCLDSEASRSRLNKHNVNQMLIGAGITAIESVEIRHHDDLKKNYEKIASFGLPLVAKPSEDTASMAGFEMLNAIDEIHSYIDRHIGKLNHYYSDKIVEKAIIQPYIPIELFDEYTLDFVSYQGKHHLVGIGMYIKDQHKVMRGYKCFDRGELPNIEFAVQYVEKCLDAMKVHTGFSHNEVFWDGRNKIYLIESNNRYSGQPVSAVYDASYSQHAFVSYLDLVQDKVTNDRVDKRCRYAEAVMSYNCHVDEPDQLYLEGLTCEYQVNSFRGKGKKKNSKTFYEALDRINQLTSMILVIAEDAEILKYNVELLRERERNGTLFVNTNN